MPRQQTRFKPGRYYYLSNVGNTGEEIFDGAGNHRYFKEKLEGQTKSVLELVAWCLIANQYHLIIKVRSSYFLRKEIQRLSKGAIKRIPPGAFSSCVSDCLSGVLAGYAKAYNRMYRRRGSLFRESFTKIELQSPDEIRLFTKAVLRMEVVVKEKDMHKTISSAMTGLSKIYIRQDLRETEDCEWDELIDNEKLGNTVRTSKKHERTPAEEILEKVEEEVKHKGINLEGMFELENDRNGNRKLIDVLGRGGGKFWQKVMVVRVKTLARHLMRT